mgnify:CR=1 FL=1
MQPSKDVEVFIVDEALAVGDELFQRIAELYAEGLAGEMNSPSPFGSLAEVLAEEASREQSGKNAAARAFWQEQLQGWPEVKSFGETRVPIAADFIRESRPLPAALWQSLTGFADEHKLGWPDLLLAGLSAQLSLSSGQDKTLLGLMMMNRIGSASLTVPCMQTLPAKTGKPTSMMVSLSRTPPSLSTSLISWLIFCTTAARCWRHSASQSAIVLMLVVEAAAAAVVLDESALATSFLAPTRLVSLVLVALLLLLPHAAARTAKAQTSAHHKARVRVMIRFSPPVSPAPVPPDHYHHRRRRR